MRKSTLTFLALAIICMIGANIVYGGVSFQTHEEELENLIHELVEKGANQNPAEIDSISMDSISDSIIISQEENRYELVGDTAIIVKEIGKSLLNDMEQETGTVYAEEEALRFPPEVYNPILRSDSIEVDVSTPIDIEGAISFAEEYLTAVYNHDIPKMKAMTCQNPDVQAFWTQEVYANVSMGRKNLYIYENALQGIPLTCIRIYDLDITTFSGTRDIPGYHKVNVRFAPFNRATAPHDFSLRVMVFQKIDDDSFSIFSIK